jgi:hypothetical protein
MRLIWRDSGSKFFVEKVIFPQKIYFLQNHPNGKELTFSPTVCWHKCLNIIKKIQAFDHHLIGFVNLTCGTRNHLSLYKKLAGNLIWKSLYIHNCFCGAQESVWSYREKILVKLTQGPQNDSQSHKNSVDRKWTFYIFRQGPSCVKPRPD